MAGTKNFCVKSYVRPVRRIGTEIRSGPVRSGPVRSAVSDRSRTDLGPDRSHKKSFDGAKFFEKLDRVAAIDFVKIAAILAIFESFEVRKYRMPFFGEFSRSSQDLHESDYDWIKSRDDRLNSPKICVWIFHCLV